MSLLPQQNQPDVLEILPTVPSTNTYLAKSVASSQRHRHVVLAEHQSAGRGRRGHDWLSPFACGIYISVAWKFNFLVESISLFSLYIAVAVVNSLQSIGIKKPEVKWPNDILVNNKKISGILLDMRGKTNTPTTVIVGIGINYDIPDLTKKKMQRDITDICQCTKRPVSRNFVAAVLIKNVFQILDYIEQGKTSGLVAKWREHDCLEGKSVCLTYQDKIIKGVVAGIDKKGCLLINVNGCIQRYAYGKASLSAVQ